MTDKLTPEHWQDSAAMEYSRTAPLPEAQIRAALCVAWLAGYRAAQSAQPAPAPLDRCEVCGKDNTNEVESDGFRQRNYHTECRQMERNAQPAAVGAKLSESEREQLYALIERDATFAELDECLESIVSRRVASARAAGMEYGAKVLDEMAEQAERDFEPSKAVEYYRSKATAIRAAIGATNEDE